MADPHKHPSPRFHAKSHITAQANAMKLYSEAMAASNAVFTDKDNIRVFMEHGWVMPLHTLADDVERIVSLFEGNPDVADEEMCAIFQGMTDYIKSGLIRRFHSRAHIFSEAFEAHEAGKYNLSVPVFLAQADGIWNERGGNHIFRGKREKAVEKHADEFVKDSLTRSFILALKSRSFPLFQSMRPHPGSSYPLNRNLVLHGDSLDYGTRKNSFQAMAFLDYCGIILPDLPDE